MLFYERNTIAQQQSNILFYIKQFKRVVCCNLDAMRFEYRNVEIGVKFSRLIFFSKRFASI